MSKNNNCCKAFGRTVHNTGFKNISTYCCLKKYIQLNYLLSDILLSLDKSECCCQMIFPMLANFVMARTNYFAVSGLNISDLYPNNYRQTIHDTNYIGKKDRATLKYSSYKRIGLQVSCLWNMKLLKFLNYSRLTLKSMSDPLNHLVSI